MEYIEVKTTKKFGRGVYAKRNIPKDAVIEFAPLIVLDEGDKKIVRESNLFV